MKCPGHWWTSREASRSPVITLVSIHVNTSNMMALAFNSRPKSLIQSGICSIKYSMISKQNMVIMIV